MAPAVAEDGRITGIIYPPPEVRNIVDKTASFVARNGPEFEQRIKQNEVNNPKFNFLNSGDPYHAYYQYKVTEIRDGKPTPAAPAPSAGLKSTTPSVPAAPSAASLAKSEAVKQRQSELLKSVQKEPEAPPPKDPPPEFEFIADPPSISAFDLDVVKLTAQFVARNGRQFLTNLMNREQRNYQFDFLRPQHSLFQYFTKLLEQYTKVLIPPKDLMKKLDDEGKNEKLVREQVKYRVAWIKHQEAKRRKEEEEAERERISYAQVDWHGFVVVETVDYQPWEVGNFPPPTNPTEVGARVLIQRRAETSIPVKSKTDKDKEDGERSGANLQVEDMEEESSDEYEEDDSDEDEAGLTKPPAAIGKPVMAVDAAPAVMQPPPTLPAPGKVEIRKYDPKQAQAARKKTDTEEYLVSPITGEKIPASKVPEHMRIGLLDPRWVDERDKQITARATEQQVFAPGQAIESSLKQLAERRTDIFGVGEEAAQEAAIGMKMGEEDRRVVDDKIQWDGHTSSAEATARAARANITLNDQIEQIHRAKGLIPDNSKEGIGPKFGKGPPQMPQPPVPKPPAQVAPPPQPVRPPQIPQMPPQVTGANLMPIRPPQPPMMITPQPFFMPPQPPQMIPFPNMPTSVPPHPGIPKPPMDHHSSGEPPSKRMKGEESLIPESQFLARHHSPVTFKVAVPNIADKPEWKLNGQMITLTLPLQDMVSVIKSKLNDELSMPPGKQKLQIENIFLKDSNTLAFYNITPGMVMNLQLKERGGRKK